MTINFITLKSYTKRKFNSSIQVDVYTTFEDAPFTFYCDKSSYTTLYDKLSAINVMDGNIKHIDIKQL